MTDVGYPIRAAARLTGISVDSIRAWERRYEAVQPMRAKGGRRYSEADIHRLRLLKRAVDHGHGISLIAPLKNSELERLPLAKNHEITDHPSVADGDYRGELRSVIAYLEEFDSMAADRVLGKMATLLKPRDFVHWVAIPLMSHVGDAWKQGSLSVAQEHLISAVMRSILGMLIRFGVKDNPKNRFIFTTPAGELHEFGILIAAMLAAAGGMGILFLGPNLPNDEIFKAVKKTKPRGLVLSIMASEKKNRKNWENLIALLNGAPQDLEIIIGGQLPRGEQRLIQSLGANYLPSFNEYERYLERIGAKFDP